MTGPTPELQTHLLEYSGVIEDILTDEEVGRGLIL